MRGYWKWWYNRNWLFVVITLMFIGSALFGVSVIFFTMQTLLVCAIIAVIVIYKVCKSSYEEYKKEMVKK